MKRRGFLNAAAVTGMAAFASGAMASVPRAVAGIAGAGFRVGQAYRSACGGSLRLVAIDQHRAQPRCHQYRLRFEGEGCAALSEGLHRLDGPQGPLDLFLQPSSDGARVAWFNHLA